MLDVDVSLRSGVFQLEARFRSETTGVLCLFGRSGAGKTTLLDVLAGLRRPDRGRIALGDEVLFDSERNHFVPPDRRRIGYVFQDSALFPHLDVRRNLRYGESLLGPGERLVKFEEVVEMLGLSDLLERTPRRLSGGEKQRVAIGRALLASPRLLLLDEPLASVDRARANQILHFIEALRDAFAIPIVYVSHAVSEVARLARNLAVMEAGRIVGMGPVGEVMSEPSLAELFGPREAGAVVAARVTSHHDAEQLTHLAFSGGVFRLPRFDARIGAEIHLHVRAADVALAIAEPTGLSVLNIFPGVVRSISETEALQVLVEIDVGAKLVSRITRYSQRALGVEVGSRVWAMVKSVALDSGAS